MAWLKSQTEVCKSCTNGLVAEWVIGTTVPVGRLAGVHFMLAFLRSKSKCLVCNSSSQGMGTTFM